MEVHKLTRVHKLTTVGFSSIHSPWFLISCHSKRLCKFSWSHSSSQISLFWPVYFSFGTYVLWLLCVYCTRPSHFSVLQLVLTRNPSMQIFLQVNSVNISLCCPYNLHCKIWMIVIMRTTTIILISVAMQRGNAAAVMGSLNHSPSSKQSFKYARFFLLLLLLLPHLFYLLFKTKKYNNNSNDSLTCFCFVYSSSQWNSNAIAISTQTTTVHTAPTWIVYTKLLWPTLWTILPPCVTQIVFLIAFIFMFLQKR